MSCKSALFANNSTDQTVNAGGTISFGNALRRYGQDIFAIGGAVEVHPGYYDIDTNFTVTAGGAGTLVVSLLKDGVVIPGANASITTVNDTIYTIAIPAIVRNMCPAGGVITANVTGVNATVNNASIVVKRI